MYERLLGNRRVLLSALAWMAWALPTATAAPVRIVVLNPTPQVAAPLQAIPHPLSVRVETGSGQPIPGLVVSFQINQCAEILGFPCPTLAEYGGFQGPAGLVSSVLATTDSNGVATAAPYVVGAPLPRNTPFWFDLWPNVGSQVTPGGFAVSLEDALSPIGGFQSAMTRIEVGEAALAIPTLGGAGAAALTLVLACAGLLRLSRRSPAIRERATQHRGKRVASS